LTEDNDGGLGSDGGGSEEESASAGFRALLDRRGSTIPRKQARRTKAAKKAEADGNTYASGNDELTRLQAIIDQQARDFRALKRKSEATKDAGGKGKRNKLSSSTVPPKGDALAISLPNPPEPSAETVPAQQP
jgi:hypothetical protein